jgi:hypothetical protein
MPSTIPDTQRRKSILEHVTIIFIQPARSGEALKSELSWYEIVPRSFRHRDLAKLLPVSEPSLPVITRKSSDFHHHQWIS